MSIVVSEPVRRKAERAGAGWWLAGLPGLVADLEREWGLRVGRAFPDGTEAWVGSVVLGSGEAAVLKLVLPQAGDHARHEITTLTLAAGEGCVRLLRHDAGRGALLLERLGPSLTDLGWPARRRQEVLCDLAARVWRPAPDCGLPTGAEKARDLAAYIEQMWADLDHPCSRLAVDHALACSGRREAAYHPDRAQLLHGDVHAWNALARRDDVTPGSRRDERGTGGATSSTPRPGVPVERGTPTCIGGFALVDPDGLLAEPEYDIGVIMREDPVELLEEGSRARAARLAARTGLDAEAAWEWGVVERVSTGLLCVAIGLEPVGSQMLAAAEAVARGA